MLYDCSIFQLDYLSLSLVRAILGVLGFPSLKTALGIYFIEKEGAVSNTGSNPLPISVKLYSTLIGYSDTILSSYNS